MENLNEVIEETSKAEESQEQTTEQTAPVEEQVERTLWDEVAEVTGFKPEEVLDEDSHSVGKYAQVYAEHKVKQFQEDYWKEVPLAKQIAEIERQGGNVYEFLEMMKTPDFSDIDLSEAPEETLKAVVYEEMKLKGIPENRIKSLISIAEKEGNLLEEATNSQKEILKFKEVEAQKMNQRLQEKNNMIKQQVQSFSETLEGMISKGELGNVIINDQDRKGFFDFITEQVKVDEETGKFFIEVALDDKNLTNEILTEYYRFKKGDMSQVIKKAAKTEELKKFRSKLSAEQLASQRQTSETKTTNTSKNPLTSRL